MIDYKNKKIIERVTIAYDKFMSKLMDMRGKEKSIMKEYREVDRIEKIKNIRKQLDI